MDMKTTVLRHLYLRVHAGDPKKARFDNYPLPVPTQAAGPNPIRLECLLDAIAPADCLSRQVLGGDRPALAEVGGRERLCPREHYAGKGEVNQGFQKLLPAPETRVWRAR